MKNLEEILKNDDNFHDSLTPNLIALILKQVTSKIYQKIYPKAETKKDVEFFNILHTFQWFSCDNLHIPINFNDDLWNLAIEELNSMDNATNVNEKLFYANLFVETIQETLGIVSKGSVSADDLMPVTIWVLLKACPKRFCSNVK